MLTFDGVAFYRATIHLAAARQAIKSVDDSNFAVKRDGDIPANTRTLILESVVPLHKELSVIGARVTNLMVGRLKDALSDQTKPFSYENFTDAITHIQSRLRDELSLISLFVIEQEKAELFAPKEPLFGPVVATKFQSAAVVEINEAAKCLALGRSTASAFHSIRTLEAAIRAMSRCLGIPDPIKGVDRSWAKALGAIETETDKRWPKSTRMAGDGVLFEGLQAALAAIQNPYRNSTMHLETTYTDDDAKHLFEMVKGLMQRVANRMDENGLPLA